MLGISSGASLGVALVVLWLGSGEASWLSGLGLFGDVAVISAASAGAGAALALILWASRRMGNLTLLVLGVLLGYATGALTTILLHMSLAERVQAFVLWTFGSFGGVGWNELQILAPLLIVTLAAALLLGKPLNALALGEGFARSVGVEVGRLRRLLLLAAAILAGAVTAFCGPIAFLGVAVPHLCRLWLRSADHRLLLPASALAGAAAALLSELLDPAAARRRGVAAQRGHLSARRAPGRLPAAAPACRDGRRARRLRKLKIPGWRRLPSRAQPRSRPGIRSGWATGRSIPASTSSSARATWPGSSPR